MLSISVTHRTGRPLKSSPRPTAVAPRPWPPLARSSVPQTAGRFPQAYSNSPYRISSAVVPLDWKWQTGAHSGPVVARRGLASATPPANKKKTIEQIYQKKTQVEHILLRPDSYVGSLDKTSTTTWVLDKSKSRVKQKEVDYVPGLYKIFDEILVNASDNKQRDSTMDSIQVTIDEKAGRIEIQNNGRGIPIQVHKKENLYLPELLLGHLLTGSNFDDSVSKVTGGRNGYGAKLANIFSRTFTVETVDAKRKLKYVQTWTDHMGNVTQPTITPVSEDVVEDYTKISFEPDLALFKLPALKGDILDVMTRRVYDIAACHQDLKVHLNGTLLQVSPEKYFNVSNSDMIFEKINNRWSIGVGTVTTGSFTQVSFVNAINTLKGGTHVQYVSDQIVKYVVDHMKRKNKQVPILPSQVKNHLLIVVVSLIENPAFDSQTKENLTTQPSHFGSDCILSERLLKSIISQTNITDLVTKYAEMQQKQSFAKVSSAKRKLKITGIDKLDDANEAGGPKSRDCTLIITEGDSAKALAVSGLSVVGRDHYGVYPVQGKILNVREAKTLQVIKNEEILNLIKIIGLRSDKKYENFEEDSRDLRYGRVMLMADSDQDGSHVKGLFINFLHHFWPALLKKGDFLVEFVTPIVKAFPLLKSATSKPLSFFSLQDYNAWKRERGSEVRQWRIKYYKGLGTSTAAEAREYFSDLQKHIVKFKWTGKAEGELIDMVFNKAKASQRKEWLKEFQPARLAHPPLRSTILTSMFLQEDHVDLKPGFISYTDFVNKELLSFSHYDTVRSIPSLVDGLKPSQRKVLYASFKKNLTEEMKVAQLAGFVAEQAAYHHGETSLFGTIIHMAQNFVGSNNLPLLVPAGQFGTRLQGGKDAASARYIYTALSPYTRLIFMPEDELTLKFLDDDGFSIEPEHYAPIIPIVLVNGTEGVGTGYRTIIPSYHPLQIIDRLIAKIDGKPITTPLVPWFRGFRGQVSQVLENNITTSVVTRGIIKQEGAGFVVSELPVGKWTHDYKVHLNGLVKPHNYIKDFTEHHTDETVKFKIAVTAEQMAKITTDLAGDANGDLVKLFKLETSFTMKHMNLFDRNGKLKWYARAEDILEEFFDVRKEFYQRRKDLLVSTLSASAFRLQEQCRFVDLVIQKKVQVFNQTKDQVNNLLETNGFKPLPLRNAPSGAATFDYVMGFSISQFSKENIARLNKERSQEETHLNLLKTKSGLDLWRDDLVKLRSAIENQFV